MRTRFVALVAFAGLGLPLFSGTLAVGADEPAKQSPQAKLDGIVNLLRAVGGLEIPDLSGLISPEKMGLLTDNQSRIRDNETTLLSGNEPEITALSGNETEFTCLSGNKCSVLSNLRLFSGITVNLHVTIQDNEAAKAVKPKTGKKADRDAKKAKKRKVGRKAKKS